MLGEKLRVVVTDENEIIIDADGFIGESCITETHKLLEKLKEFGIELGEVNTEFKPEFYMSTTNKNKTHQI